MTTTRKYRVVWDNSVILGEYSSLYKAIERIAIFRCSDLPKVSVQEYHIYLRNWKDLDYSNFLNSYQTLAQAPDEFY